MKNDEWPDEVIREITDFYDDFSLSEGQRESIVQLRNGVLETRRWKRISGALAVSIAAILMLGGYAFVNQGENANQDNIAVDQQPMRHVELDDSDVQIVPTRTVPIRTVSLEVPTMQCPVNNWPKVKETLEAEPGVEVVLLAAQTREDVIDNRVVHVAVGDDFQTNRAVSSLARAGYSGASVKEP